MKTLKAVPLVGLVDTNSSSDSNVLKSIQTDLENFVKNIGVQKPEFMMPMLYAYRLVTAGLYAQGIQSKETYDVADTLFSNMGIQIGSSISKEEQIAFQEKSLDYGMDFIHSYYSDFDKIAGHFFVAAAKKGFCLCQAVYHALADEIEDEEQRNKVCREVTTLEFCMAFFKSGLWEPESNDFPRDIYKVGIFLDAYMQ